MRRWRNNADAAVVIHGERELLRGTKRDRRNLHADEAAKLANRKFDRLAVEPNTLYARGRGQRRRQRCANWRVSFVGDAENGLRALLENFAGKAAVADGVTLESQERPVRGQIRKGDLERAVRPAGRSRCFQPEHAAHSGQDYAIGRKQLMRHGEFAGEITIAVHQFGDTSGRGKSGELRDAAPNGKTGKRETVAILRPGGESAHERPGGAVVVTQGVIERILVGEPADAPIR